MLRGNPAIVIVALISLLPAISFSSTTNDNSSATSQLAISQISKMPLAFTENQGQWNEKVKFRANADVATLWFSLDGAYYQFTRAIPSDKPQVGPVDPIHLTADREDREPVKYETIMIKASFVGANKNPQMVGTEMMGYKCNYFIGNDPNEWHTDVPNYQAVLYKQVYEGIDLKYYGNGQQVEYDFVVSPGADYSQIKIQYEGAESISVNADGELVVETKWGKVVERKPIIYQIENDKRVPIEGIHILQDGNSFGFKLEDYNVALPVIIDPVLEYSTYLGGSSLDNGNSIAVGSTGEVYITGGTYSNDFPTHNPYQSTYHANSADVFVTKLSRLGNSVLYSTYIGGNVFEAGYGIALDVSGAVYIVGSTLSTDFPTVNPYQGASQGFDSNVFVTKLNSSGNNLIYSTYLGGSGDDNGYGISINAYGEAYIIGSTGSSDFPTLNPYQGTSPGGSSDAFVTKLSSSGNDLIYSTYLGGGSNDYGSDIVTDDSGAAYLTGSTSSSDFPTLNPYQSTKQTYFDVFITKLSSSGNSLIYSTYLGGSGGDEGYSITVDTSGAAYLTGKTWSADFPMRSPYQDTYQDGASSSNAFVTKLSSSGDSLIFSTYLGGSVVDYGTNIAVDATGATYVSGVTVSTDFPMIDPYQETKPGGYDAFVTKFSNSGISIVYSTCVGGSVDDWGTGLAIDALGAIYLTGWTYSSDFPTHNPYQGTLQGGSYDAFVTKLSPFTCCGLYTTGFTGNTNCIPDGKRNLADITTLIDRVYLTKSPLCCEENGNVNGDIESKLNLADIVRLIDHVYLSKNETTACE